MTEASVAVERTADDAVRIAVRGEVDLANVADVEGQLLGAISNRVVDVVVDLADLVYVDSAGLRVLFQLAKRLETLQTRLTLLVPPDSAVRKVIDLSGIAAIAVVEPPA